MKKILPEAELSAQQLNNIPALAKSVGLSEQTVRILCGRGIDTKDKISAFIHPGKNRFLNPFLMSGMREAIELIKQAKDEEWSVAVYGDYDADGICASTILYRALCEYGIDAYVFVPERRAGYGLTVQTIDHVFEECFPQLFITVDCGISNASEVEYIKEQGAEVIVTDHHELPDTLPDCICINPKISDNYPYDNLCGAGVAFKVACALMGDFAYKYLDFAAIATIADSVPLTCENRDIVTEGLNIINKNPRANYSGFFNKSGEKITAQNIAFWVVPKINAAGRMGDAKAALQLFLSDDEREIYDYTVKLTSYNMVRQKACDELYYSAKNKIKDEGVADRVIVLWDESWDSGFVGIVAARLAEEYCRPTLLFVKNGALLKGSVRSIDGVNIYEALKACSRLISGFGGHSQAAGVNVEQSNLRELESELNKFLSENYSEQAFVPSYLVSGESKLPFSEQIIKELELFEPCGVGNRKPQFALNAATCQAHPIKFGSQHLSIKIGGLDFIYFSGLRHEKLLKSPLNKYLICEYAVSSFRGKEQIKGYVRDVIYSPCISDKVNEQVQLNAISTLKLCKVNAQRKNITQREAQALLDEVRDRGTLFIANHPETLKRYDLGNLEVNYFTLAVAATSCAIIVSPLAECDLSDYEKIIYLDDPFCITLPSLEGKDVAVCTEISGLSFLERITSNREEMLEVFKALSLKGEPRFAYDMEDFARSGALSSHPLQTLFALYVFEQLGLVTFNDGKLSTVKGIKTQLTNSELYNLIVEYENGNR